MEKGISLSQAAKQLGIDKEALRKRALRGSVKAYKDSSTGQWFVILPLTSGTADIGVPEGVDTENREGVPVGIPAPNQSTDFFQALLVEKDAQITLLGRELETRNAELEARRREVQELHVLLQNTQRLLIAPTTSPNAPQSTKGHDEQEMGRGDFIAPERGIQSPNLSIIVRLKRLFTGQ
jgi:hypothetical protein